MAGDLTGPAHSGKAVASSCLGLPGSARSLGFLGATDPTGVYAQTERDRFKDWAHAIMEGGKLKFAVWTRRLGPGGADGEGGVQRGAAEGLPPAAGGP